MFAYEYMDRKGVYITLGWKEPMQISIYTYLHRLHISSGVNIAVIDNQISVSLYLSLYLSLLSVFCVGDVKVNYTVLYGYMLQWDKMNGIMFVTANTFCPTTVKG